MDDDCAAGEVLTGGACSTDNNPTCGPCDPSTLPPNGQYTTPGTCDFVCNTQFVRVGELCPACTVVCPTGSYPSGQCSGSTDYECTPCENRREGTYFTGTPGTVNDPESCGVDDCTSRCNVGLTPTGDCTPFENPACEPCTNVLGPNEEFIDECDTACVLNFFRENAAGRCEPCTTECPAGQEQTAECTRESDTGCGPCPVPLPVGAEWTTGCNFVCVAGRYSSAPGTCTECTSSCDCGEYLSGACGGVLNYECLACENLGAEQYFTSNGTVINGAGSCGIADCRAECVGGNVLRGECGGCSNRICEGAGGNPPNSSFPPVCTFTCDWTCDDQFNESDNGTWCNPCTATCPPGSLLVGDVHTHVGQDLCAVQLASPECGICGREFVRV